MSHGWIRAKDIKSGVVETSKLATGAVTPEKLSAKQVRTLQATYIFSRDGGTVGAKTLKASDGSAVELPADAVVLRAYAEAVRAPTSGGAATIAFGVTGDAEVMLAATAFDGGAFDLDDVAAIATGLPKKFTAAKSVLMTIAGAALTAGHFNVWIEYVVGD